jgi:hypothetical protein
LHNAYNSTSYTKEEFDKSLKNGLEEISSVTNPLVSQVAIEALWMLQWVEYCTHKNSKFWGKPGTKLSLVKSVYITLKGRNTGRGKCEDGGRDWNKGSTTKQC